MCIRDSADTDLYAIAQEVACRLKIPAQQNSIVISVQGSSAFVTGVPYILDEMMYNLADNAVKYNRPGGRVVISTGTEGGHAYMQEMCIRDSNGADGGCAVRCVRLLRSRCFGAACAEHFRRSGQHDADSVRFAPVSYTHLDVYKRQVFVCGSIRVKA